MNVQRPNDNREVVDLDAWTTNALQALCCGCGQLREVKYGGPRNYRPPHFCDELARNTSERYTAKLRCTQCRQATKHAILRQDKNRDWAEENLIGEPQFTHDDDIRILIGVHIERLAEQGIYVRIAADWKPWKPGNRACITQYLNTWNWEIAINKTHSPATQLKYILESEKWTRTSNSTRWMVQPETATLNPKRWLWLNAGSE